MSVFGNPIGNATPRANWAETDAKKASFIENKPDFLSANGGVLTGNLAMSGNAITGIASPVNANDAANKVYVDGKRITWTAQIGTAWDDNEIEVSLTGILATDMPHVSPVYGEDYPAQREAWGCISEGEAAEGKIIFRCFEETPNIAIPIQVEVIR